MHLFEKMGKVGKDLQTRHLLSVSILVLNIEWVTVPALIHPRSWLI